MKWLGKRSQRRVTFITICIVSIIIIVICILIPVYAITTFDCQKKMSIAKNKDLTLLQYFNLTDGIDIVWAHAVNSQEDLTTALSDSKIMMLEADVLIDPIRDIPIMAHPPATTSDITLFQWLHQVFITKNKGIKLDFKQTNVIAPSIKILQELLKNYTVKLPVLLNADILTGPNNDVTIPVNSNFFIKSSSVVKGAVLSPGWTTGFHGNLSQGYTQNNVDEMHNTVRNTDQYVTFPIRASLVSKSLAQLKWLLQQNPKIYTLTVWTSKNDNFNIKELKALRDNREQIYYDLPEPEVALLKSIDG